LVQTMHMPKQENLQRWTARWNEILKARKSDIQWFWVQLKNWLLEKFV